ncbi:uncharacterized protein LOC115623624 isoform X2 [Scaptodrosophila lebanonensis]|uniref:Uncharacterized protein LOC115623624 isoform X2 n=1 Tax=Drosophila lebanonensis TaxID=7225 RepID=A0A6J2TFZ1_DROLE|nr:uncharacterized protein LOC115623624 isoform X2 [Scaptodrosophila lebanonensis]
MSNNKEGSQLNEILEVAQNRPGTNVAKCIQAYYEKPELSTLVTLLEEVSKNSDFSTDLRLSLEYYLDEFSHHCDANGNVSRRAALIAAGSVVQYCGKIYSDRVEYIYQIAEQQIEALLTADLGKDNPKDNNTETANKSEEPKKRRAKKLTQKEVDPYMITVEPRKFKTMSPEKRFSNTGFIKCSRTRTIEYLYQDHIPPSIWKHAPVVDPDNPADEDEKKNYKMYIYHAEHRYNTLIPDIPFDRLNLIKEYVYSHQLNMADILNEHMTTREYLNEYIALENQVLADRYGVSLRPQKHKNLEIGGVPNKRLRLELCGENLNGTEPLTALDSGFETGESGEGIDSAMETMFERSLDGQDVNQSHENVDSAMENTLESSAEVRNDNQTEVLVTLSSREVSGVNTSTSDLDQTTQAPSILTSNINSTMNSTANEALCFNDSSVLESTRIELPNHLSSSQNSSALVGDKDDLTKSNGQSLIDSGINITDDSPLATEGLSFDDEGVVLSDIEELRRLSPPIMVQDLLPDVPNENNLTVIPDQDTLNGVSVSKEDNAHRAQSYDIEESEEILNVQRTHIYDIELNIFQFPKKELRRKGLFKLPDEFQLFMQARNPQKPEPEAKNRKAPRAITLLPVQQEASVGIYPRIQASIADDSINMLEFGENYEFHGFNDDVAKTYKDRRPTHDSGIDHDNSQTLDAHVAMDAPHQLEDAFDLVEMTIDALAERLANEIINEAVTEHQDESDCEKAPSSSTNAASVEENIPTLNETTVLTEEEAVPAIKVSEDTIGPSTMEEDLNNEEAEQNRQNHLNESAAVDSVFEDENSPDMPPVETSSSFIDNLNIMENQFEDVSDSSAMIRNWHLQIAPALQAAHDRQNFDIKNIGTEMIDVCLAHNSCATMADVMAGKDVSTFSRYFLACLLLTNQGNFSLNPGAHNPDEPVDMNDLKITLLTTKRQEINPEDDIGNVNSNFNTPGDVRLVKPGKRKMETSQVNLKTFYCQIRKLAVHHLHCNSSKRFI